MRGFLNEYNNFEIPVDIESIVSKVWLNIEYFSLLISKLRVV